MLIFGGVGGGGWAGGSVGGGVSGSKKGNGREPDGAGQWGQGGTDH